MRNLKKVSLKTRQSTAFFGDPFLLFLVVSMVLFGLIMVYSASFIFAQEKTGNGLFFVQKQLIYAIIGFLILFITSQIKYTFWDKISYPLLIFATLSLCLVFIPGIGKSIGGARRWICFGAFHFQPGEFAKFAVIFFVARQLHRKQSRIHRVTAGILSQFIAPFPALLLLLLQPDFGTTVIILCVVYSMLFIGGVPLKYLLFATMIAIVLGAWVMVGAVYRRSRLLAFLDPWNDPSGKGFQILQSLVGLHHGGFWGVGLGNSKEKLFYLPEAYNDFIFSVMGEELGFLGVLVIVSCFFIFIYKGFKIAIVCETQSKNRFGTLLASGITMALGLQGLVNISVVLGLLPTKGLTLPFMSYGGSALLVDFFAVGVLLNVAKNRI